MCLHPLHITEWVQTFSGRANNPNSQQKNSQGATQYPKGNQGQYAGKRSSSYESDVGQCGQTQPTFWTVQF